MNTNQQIKQTCNHCKRSDITDFSKCRYCGQKYGTTPPPAPKTYLTEKALAVCAFAVIAIGYSFHERQKSEHARDASLATITREIKATHRPRILEFYATWCGPCQAYGPIVEAAKAKYSGMDVYRYNIEDADAHDLCVGLGVRAIPVTVFFNSDGKLINQEVGALNSEMLDDEIKKIL